MVILGFLITIGAGHPSITEGGFTTITTDGFGYQTPNGDRLG